MKKNKETKFLDTYHQCDTAIEPATPLYDQIPGVVKRLMKLLDDSNSYSHVEPIPIPSNDSVVQLIHQARRILFPGYFTQSTLAQANLEYYLGQETTSFLENLSRQIISAFQHDCFRHDLPCTKCSDQGHEIALKIVRELPEIKKLLDKDIRAAFEGDPAAKGYDEIIFCYPGFMAISIYRLANLLHKNKVPVIPRIMGEYAHSITGIDIHPGATIGEHFFIDHGTGVVIGETTEIGKRVRLYQGVTLGALSLPKDAGDQFRYKKRHPTIEDDVIVYSNTTILGGETVIGARSVIGGNIWITESVPPDTKVLLKRPELIYAGNGRRKMKKQGDSSHGQN
ncbi:MAG: serine acetyltransferase [Deltaproteobacteria bacterium]|jgi:serine O-acetyltransferase|nr:serine acetyltransferase [Deltaproteobacteria bacterium]